MKVDTLDNATFKLGKRYTAQPNRYAEVTDLDLPNRPTLITFCGAQTTNASDANGFAKLIQQLIGRSDVYGRELQIIGAHYTGDSGDLYQNIPLHNYKSIYGKAKNYMPPTKRLVDEHFLPLVENTNGERLPVEVAIKNMRNVNMVGYSYGGVIISEIGNVLCEHMKEIGYSDREIAEITEQACVITAGSCSLIGGSKASFTTIHVVNLGDKMVESSTPNMKIVEKMLVGTGKKDERLSIIPVEGKNENVVIVQPIEPMPRVIRPEQKGSFSTKGGELQPQYMDFEGHTTYTYFTYGLGENGLMVPNIIANALTNAINSSIRSADKFERVPSADELLEPSRQASFRRASREEVGVYADPARLADNIGFTERVARARNSMARTGIE